MAQTSTPTRIEQHFFHTWDRSACTDVVEYYYVVTWADGSTSTFDTIPNEWIAIECETYRAQQAERLAALDLSLEANRQLLGEVA